MYAVSRVKVSELSGSDDGKGEVCIFWELRSVVWYKPGKKTSFTIYIWPWYIKSYKYINVYTLKTSDYVKDFSVLWSALKMEAVCFSETLVPTWKVCMALKPAATTTKLASSPLWQHQVALPLWTVWSHALAYRIPSSPASWMNGVQC
jgi:hypothetical protein